MKHNELHILVIDDDDAHRLLVKRALKGLGLIVLEARSPLDARQALLTHDKKIKLVLLDLNLAGAPGLEVLREIRTTFSFDALPVLLLSTSAIELDVKEGYEAGANCYLVKSGDAVQFRDMITRAVCFFADTTVAS